MKENKTIVGSQEWCAFPELNVPAIKARVDSGAKTSSIHAFNIEKFTKNGIQWVSFEVHPLQNNDETLIRCTSEVVDERAVKSSSGYSETRYVISTPIELNDELWNVELTLADRDSMGYRMLLGREAMNGRLLIDPAKKCALGKLTRKKALGLYKQAQA